MKFPALLALTIATASPLFAQWKIVDKSPAQQPDSPFVYQQKIVTNPSDNSLFSSPKQIDIVWFDDNEYTFRVIDNGPDLASYPDMVTALRKNGCLAGCNGGFFLKDNAPSGLMIAQGKPTGTFGQGGLLSGLILSSGNVNPYLLRRAEYDSGKYKPTDLIQAGPFLVDQGVTVSGLSDQNARRRTFVLHDGGDKFAIGLSGTFTLAELGTILAHQDFDPKWKIHRALNLDGGTSSGIWARLGTGTGLSFEPYKPVRNYVGIVPREGASR